MKTKIFALIFSFFLFNSNAQLSVETTPNSIVFPRFTNSNLPINTISNPIKVGIMIFNTSSNRHQFWSGTAWVDLCAQNNQVRHTFYVDGKNLKEPCGNTVILRGMNKMHV